jgi:oligoribonuclease NrnB/cAMP/cGMP phosphodiesterase (DHH superfamily)
MTTIKHSNIYILYHDHCTDGLGSKYAAWKRFGDQAQYIPVSYGNAPPKQLDAYSEVYILDFSYPRATLVALKKLCLSVVVLDHHKTAQTDLEGLGDWCRLDMSKSGCVMAWEYFHPDIPIPQLLLHVQDRDLWQWKLKGTKEVCAALPLLKGDMGYWDDCSTPDYEHKLWDLSGLRVTGHSICTHNDLKIESTLKQVQEISLFGFRVGIVNSNTLQSEIGNAICLDEKLDVNFAFVYYITQDCRVAVSLRSVGDFDVTSIARHFGGGGHRNSSGLNVTLETLINILEEAY